MSSARVFQKKPFGPARPKAVRTPSTYTTSRSSRPMAREHTQRRGRGWDEIVERELGRYHDGEARLPAEPDPRQRQLTRMGNAANGAGLALLMLGRDEEAASGSATPPSAGARASATRRPGSWGRPIGAIKARLLAGDRAGAEDAARWALEAGAADAESPIGRYAATLAQLVLGEDEQARLLASSPARARRLPARRRRRARHPRRRATGSATSSRSRPCSSRSRRATSTSRTCRSPTP